MSEFVIQAAWGMTRNGEFDGEIACSCATAFAQVQRSLTAEQLAPLTGMRTGLLGDLSLPSGAFPYAEPIQLPAIEHTDVLFTNQ